MGQLTVSFDGICTWIPQYGLTSTAVMSEGTRLPNPKLAAVPPDVMWRVVLARTLNGLSFQTPQGPQTIPPHDAVLDIQTSRIDFMSGVPSGLRQITPTTWQLRGVKFWVKNVVPAPAQTQIYPTPLLGIPSLQHYAATPPPSSPLPLSDRMVLGQQAAAFFDIAVGELEVANLDFDKDGKPLNDDVAHVTYSVITDGHPQLAVQSFQDCRISIIHFADDNPSIRLNCFGEGADSSWDFILHYAVCQSIPPTAHHPGKDDEVDGLNASCSNSQWP